MYFQKNNQINLNSVFCETNLNLTHLLFFPILLHHKTKFSHSCRERVSPLTGKHGGTRWGLHDKELESIHAESLTEISGRKLPKKGKYHVHICTVVCMQKSIILLLKERPSLGQNKHKLQTLQLFSNVVL